MPTVTATLRDDQALAARPHGSVTMVRGEKCILQREDGPDPYFDCYRADGTYVGYLRPHNIFAHFNVHEITVTVNPGSEGEPHD